MFPKLLIILALCAAVVLVVPGCEEQEVYTISQEEELERFITDSEEGRELFRIHDLVVDAVYNYAGNDTNYTDMLISTSRSVEVVASEDSLIDIGVGLYFFATITVRDKVIGRTQKQIGEQTIEENFEINIERRAYMIKLGDNSQAFAGWIIYGYDGGHPIPAVKVITPDADTFAVHYNRDLIINNTTIEGFLDIDDVFMLDKGAQVIIDGCVFNRSAVNYEGTGGFFIDGFTHPHTTGTCVADTINVAAVTDRFWNTLFIRTYAGEDTEVVYYNGSFVPYKIDL
ncbi:MAG: hypothetical protein JSV52_09435 [Candidatus Zixiibacteriota bacterium]|nr:MAG: hypothetical protein JSV52_09435 [candidate division Zixibacteria bacterium]